MEVTLISDHLSEVRGGGLIFFLSLFHTHGEEKKKTDKAIAEFNFQCKVKRKLIWQSQLCL